VQISDRITISSTPGVGMKAGPFDPSVGIVIGSVEPEDLFSGKPATVMIFIDHQRATDIEALGDALLAPAANDNPATSTASTTDATTPASTTPSYSYLNSFLKSLFAKVAKWLADATNGIAKIVTHLLAADRVETNELCVKKSDGSHVCVTGDQLAAAISGASASVPPTGAAATSSTTATSSTPTLLSEPKATSTPNEVTPLDPTGTSAPANDNPPTVPNDNTATPTGPIATATAPN